MEKLTKRSNKVFKRAFSRYRRRRNINYTPRGFGISAEVVIKCEHYDTIMSTTGSSAMFFQDTGLSFMNLAYVMTNSNSFLLNVPLYSLYRVKAMQLTYYPVNDLVNLRGIYARGSPSICIAFYPNLVSTGAGDAPRTNDNAFVGYPGVAESHSKYFSFKDGYVNGVPNSVAEWNSTATYTSFIGQLSVANGEVNNNASSQHNIIGCRIVLYVGFKNRTQ